MLHPFFNRVTFLARDFLTRFEPEALDRRRFIAVSDGAEPQDWTSSRLGAPIGTDVVMGSVEKFTVEDFRDLTP